MNPVTKRALREEFTGTPKLDKERLRQVVGWYVMYSGAPASGHAGADAHTLGMLETGHESLLLLREVRQGRRELSEVCEELKARLLEAESAPCLQSLNPNEQFTEETGHASGRGSGYYFVLDTLYNPLHWSDGSEE